MSYLDELGHPVPEQFLNALIPIDGLPDLLGKKILDLFPFQRFDRPMIENRNVGRLDLNLLQNLYDFFP